MRQRLSRPFGRPSPAYTEREAMGDLVKLIRENITHKYETGYAVRARDCSGRTRVEMLDGQGGAALGLANACDDGVAVGSGGVAEIWWAQRSQGRTVRLQYDLGTRAGRSTIERKVYPASREMPVTTPAALISVGDAVWGYAAARSTDNGETWTPIVSDQLPSTPLCVCWGNPGGTSTFVIGGQGGTHLSYSTDGGVTWTAYGQVFGGIGTDGVRDIAFNGTAFVAVGKTTNSGYIGIAYSTDGISWAQVLDSSKNGIADNADGIRVALRGTDFLVTTQGAGMQLIGISADNGATWQGYAMQTPPDTENDPAWFAEYALYTGTWAPVASNGSLVLAIGDSPRHSVAAFGDTLTDTVPGGDWFFAYDNVGQTKLLTKAPSPGYVGVTGYINDGVHTPAVFINKYPASSTGVADLLWDGTRFIAIGSSWSDPGGGGTSLAWLAITSDGVSWTNYFETGESVPGGFDDLERIRFINGRYFICGRTDLGEANIPIAYSDAPDVGWTLATASEGIFQGARDIAGEE